MKLVGLAWRNLWRNRRRSMVTISSLTFGFAAIAIFAGYTHAIYAGLGNTAIYAEGVGHLVLNRLDWEVKGKLDPGKYLFTPEEVNKVRQIVQDALPKADVIPRLQLAGLLSNGVNSSIFIANGITPEDQHRLLGPFKTRHGMLDNDKPMGGVVAEGLAGMLGLNVNNFASILVSTVNGQANALDLDVIGIVNTGNIATNDKAVTLPLAMAQTLLDAAGRADYLTVLLPELNDEAKRDVFRWAFESIPPDAAYMNALKARLESRFKADGLQLQVRTWQEMSVFYRQVKTMYDMIFTLILCVVVAIVVLSIANSVTMSVVERTREIGTLRAIGVRRHGVITLFMYEAFILVFLGLLLGAVLMVLVRVGVNGSGITYVPPANTVAVPLYIGVDWLRSAVAAGAITLLALFAALLPAYKAAYRSIVESLGHV
ncbi:ABC transporter permease [Aquitalea pelogenes]|uniref:ABC transporter permease n=1 Tax=Aquitalea pelogenes TaxID=1293573 RepID=UPI00078851F0|nr:FtsX-like permease family protein [Aquitalea pelogenes]